TISTGRSWSSWSIACPWRTCACRSSLRTATSACSEAVEANALRPLPGGRASGRTTSRTALVQLESPLPQSRKRPSGITPRGRLWYDAGTAGHGRPATRNQRQDDHECRQGTRRARPELPAADSADEESVDRHELGAGAAHSRDRSRVGQGLS